MRLADRLRDALAADADGIAFLSGDHRELDERSSDQLTPAAVLVAVTDRPEPGVILTQRNENMRRHAGQIAFPGGRVDAEDADVVAAALREAEEEVALPRAAVEVVGVADRYRTVTGYEVTPVVGVVPPDLTLRAAEAEVAAVFEAPLGFLLDRANHVRATMEWRGRERSYWEIHWEDRRIWGATAAMIVNLARRLRWT
jgi:8-oxo-dGTP pyrophosphatase MutT (NUDIX family)